MTEEEIFLAALDLLDPAARGAYVEKVCGADVALRRQVENLLAAHFKTGAFLDEPLGQQIGAGANPDRDSVKTRIAPRDGAGADAGSAPDEGPADLSFLQPPSRPIRSAGSATTRCSGSLVSARGRDQGAGPGDCRHLARPEAVLARGALGGRNSARERRSSVAGDGVHSRRIPAAAARPHRPPGGPGDRATRPADQVDADPRHGGAGVGKRKLERANGTVFLVRLSRGRKGLAELIPGKLVILTTDRYPVYDHLPPTGRQVGPTCGISRP
jgi:hypothetical protein